MYKIIPVAGVLFLLLSCSTESGTGPGTVETTFSSISTQIFDAQCSCHLSAGGTPLVLSSDEAYMNLVSVPSSQNPAYLRVNPGNPGESYLYMKLTGDSRITGLRMPRNGPPFLDDEEVEAIRKWIADGAKNN